MALTRFDALQRFDRTCNDLGWPYKNGCTFSLLGAFTVTIAITLATADGIVLGSDSTVTLTTLPVTQHAPIGQLFNSAQKVFELGPRISDFCPARTFAGGAMFWGAASFGPVSWRNFFSEFYCRSIGDRPGPIDVPALLLEFAQLKWAELQQVGLIPTDELIPDSGIGLGYICRATYEPKSALVYLRSATAMILQRTDIRVGGDPSTFFRLIEGYDNRLLDVLPAAGIDVSNFQECAKQFSISAFLSGMPLRDSIDLVHFLIYATIKTHRYKGGMPGVGGPIEIATITADRGFRWVLHKPLHESIGIPRGETQQ